MKKFLLFIILIFICVPLMAQPAGIGGGSTPFIPSTSASGGGSQWTGSTGDDITLDTTVYGNVGIGTSVPQTLLHLYDDSGVPYITMEETGAGSGTIGYDGDASFPAFVFNPELANDVTLRIQENDGLSHIQGLGGSKLQISSFNTTDGILLITAGTAAPIKFNTNSAVRMTVDAAGNVGIGTTTAQEKLDVTGSVNVSNDLYVDDTIYGGNSTDGLRFIGDNESSSTSDFYISSSGRIGINTESPGYELDIASGDILLDNNRNVYWDNNANSVLFVNGEFNIRSGYAQRIVMKSNGNLGIKETNPSYTLDVAGNIYADQTIYLGDLTIGGNAGTDVCVGSTGALCACGACP